MKPTFPLPGNDFIGQNTEGKIDPIEVVFHEIKKNINKSYYLETIYLPEAILRIEVKLNEAKVNVAHNDVNYSYHKAMESILDIAVIAINTLKKDCPIKL